MIRRVVACDGCLVLADGPDGIIQGSTAQVVRSNMKAVHWHRSKGRDLCPDCWEGGER